LSADDGRTPLTGARPLGLGAFAVIFVLSGFMNALQARANGELTQHLGNGVQAALWSFGSGFVILSVVVLASTPVRTGLRRVGPAVRAGTLSWWAVPAGVLGGIFIGCQSFATALVGVALFSVGMVAGQTANSLIVDRVGLSPIGRTAFTSRRVTSAIMATAAVIVAASGRMSGAELSVPALAAAFAGGCVVAVQQALNGRVNVATLQPVSTTWLNFLFGTAALAIGVVVGLALFDAPVRAPTSGPLWMYLGGVFGLVFIVTAAWGVPRYGVLVFALITIAGQLTAALVLDLVAPIGSNSVQWSLVAGVLITFAAVLVSAARRG
jgi:bacterial/archaeal transporter family-2 protein